MDMKTSRILKTAFSAGLKTFFIGIGVLLFMIGLLYASVWATGSVAPILIIAAASFFCMAMWDYAKMKVEREMRDEERLVDTLSKNYEK